MSKFRADSAYKEAAVKSYHSRKESGLKIKEVAKNFNISTECLRNWVRQAEEGTLNKLAYGELSEEQKTAIKEMFQAGFPDTMIAQKLGMNNLKIHYYRKSLGISSQMIVENRYNLWELMIKEGYSFEDVAEMYGAKASAVYKKLNHLRGVVKRPVKPKD